MSFSYTGRHQRDVAEITIGFYESLYRDMAPSCRIVAGSLAADAVLWCLVRADGRRRFITGRRGRLPWYADEWCFNKAKSTTDWMYGRTAACGLTGRRADRVLLSAQETGFPAHKSHRSTRRYQCWQDKAGLAPSLGSSTAAPAVPNDNAEYGRCLADEERIWTKNASFTAGSGLCSVPQRPSCLRASLMWSSLSWMGCAYCIIISSLSQTYFRLW